MRTRAALGFLLTFTTFTASAAEPCLVYDPDPQHLWNRLHETLFIRTDGVGVRHGCDRVDPLLWKGTQQPLEGDKHRAIVAVLDEFLATHGEKQVEDPLKRAFLQHDLWVLFDWTTQKHWEDYTAAQAALRQRLVPIMRRLALTPAQIDALPDNYALALRKDGGLPALPAALRDPGGPWVRVGAGHGGAIAPLHVAGFGGRSTFEIYLKLPGGRGATLEYLKRLSTIGILWAPAVPHAPDEVPLRLRSDLPQFPEGTQWALVRMLAVLDADANTRSTPVVETFQLRIHDRISRDTLVPGLTLESAQAAPQRFLEFVAARANEGQLREVRLEDSDFHFLNMHDTDEIELSMSTGNPVRPNSAFSSQLRRCFGCHRTSSIEDTRVVVPLYGSEGGLRVPPFQESAPGDEAAAVARWKGRQYDFGLLQGLWRAAD